MLLKRRKRPRLDERVRVMLWPRRSWSRSLQYVGLRIMRLRHAPREVALGVAIGVFAAITPLLGAQMVLAALLALALGASMPAAILATFIGNPVSWPLIWASTYGVGRAMMGLDALAAPVDLPQRMEAVRAALMHGSLEMVSASFALMRPVLEPMLLGSLPVGLLVAGVFYYMMLKVVPTRIRRGRPLPGRGVSARPPQIVAGGLVRSHVRSY